MTLKPWLPAIELALVVLCLFFSLRSARRKLLLENLPTSKTSGVFIGLVEVKGSAESDRPLTSFLARVPCVYYTHAVRERSTHTETESYTDSNGNSQTRTVSKTEWETVAIGGVTNEPFYLTDDRGAVLVRPDGAEVLPLPVFDRSCGPLDPLYFGKGPPIEVIGSDHVRQFVEQAIPIHTPLFVVGRARQREEVAAAEIAAHDDAPIFLITTNTEEKVRQGFGTGTLVGGGVGLLLVALYAVLGVEEYGGELQLIWDPGASYASVALYCSAYLLAWSAGWVLMIYNSMIELRQRVRQGWANVDVQLKRRADLIPALANLVSIERGYENKVQAELTALRTQARVTPPGAPGPDPAGVSGDVRAISEAYPDLKSDASFLRMQKELKDTEDRIALARHYFNDIATFYNTRLQQFPDGLIGRVGFLRPQPLLEAGGFG